MPESLLRDLWPWGGGRDDLVAASIGLYVAAFVQSGTSPATILHISSMVPMLVAAWLFGIRGGLAAAAIKKNDGDIMLSIQAVAS
jgi:hypothetical protein